MLSQILHTFACDMEKSSIIEARRKLYLSPPKLVGKDKKGSDK